MASLIKAQISQVPVGRLEITGLLGSDGKFYVAIVQIVQLFSIDTKQPARYLKALLGEDCSFDKLSTCLNSKGVNAIALQDLERLIVLLSIQGNQLAQQLNLSLVGLSLHQLFCDSFKIEFEADDRQEFLRLRMESKELFWELSNAIESWIGGRQCSQPERFYYSNAFDCINLQLFGFKSKEIGEQIGAASTGLNRDSFGKVALRHISFVQQMSANLMQNDRQLKPIDAIKQVVRQNLIKKADFRV